MKALQVIAFGAVCAWFLGGPIWDSWSANYARIMDNKARVAQIEADARESAFGTVCPDYFAASFFDRWTGYRHLSWCKGFKDRL